MTTMRSMRGHFVVTGPDIEPAQIQPPGKEAEDWCAEAKRVAKARRQIRSDSGPKAELRLARTGTPFSLSPFVAGTLRRTSISTMAAATSSARSFGATMRRMRRTRGGCA
jgi:hypothetical protein